MISLESLFIEDDYNKNFDISTESQVDFREVIKINNELYDQLSRSTEGVIGNIIISIIKLIEKVIVFIAKSVIWITKTVINKIASFIAWITGNKKPPKEQSQSLAHKLKSLWKSSEDNNLEGVNALAADIKSYIKSPNDVKNMKPEELVFYKVFLISVSVNDTKYITELFNRQTSLLKEEGEKIDKNGQTLMTLSNLDQKQNNRYIGEEDWLFSLEEDYSGMPIKFPKMSETIEKEHRINTNVNDAYSDIISSICRSIYEKPDDSVWLNKLRLIFSNGSKELNIVSKNMKSKQEYLEKISQSNISDKLKAKIKEYSKSVTNFQSSIMSYMNCINYFVKYQNIRMNLTRRFNNLASVYRRSA